MGSTGDEDHSQLVHELATGFGAMLEQLQELARRNTDLEQRLARVRNEQQIESHDNEPLVGDHGAGGSQQSAEEHPTPKRRQSSSVSGEDHHSSLEGATGKDTALAIAVGVDAWKAITQGEGPLWRRFNRERASRSHDRGNTETGSEAIPLPEGHLQVDPDSPEQLSCPFTSMAHLGGPQDTNALGSMTQRPGSLPTPPPNQDALFGAPTQVGSQHTNLSPPASTSGSASKCAIRMLDKRSPEEVAEYFETHKHEIPRSHSLCVKRYQSNAQSIRQLDAKYGSLVNMVQGLGLKHQPLLPTKEDEHDMAESDTRSADKVEEWAGGIGETPSGPAATDREASSSFISSTDDRQGHFDRPLKEIRVGESPSRPWGISVPASGPIKGLDESEAAPTPRVAASKAATPRLQPQIAVAKDDEHGNKADDTPRMIFTGPVFIGYGADQAAALIKQCGWEPHGSTQSKVSHP